MTNDDERAAREWLLSADGSAAYRDEDDVRHRATILRLIDRPVLPRPGEIPLEVLDAMFNAAADNPPDSSIPDMAAAYAVLHAHLTAPPKLKKVGAWAVKWPDGTHTAYTAQADAIRAATEGSRIVRLIEAADDQ